MYNCHPQLQGDQEPPVRVFRSVLTAQASGSATQEGGRDGQLLTLSVYATARFKQKAKGRTNKFGWLQALDLNARQLLASN